MATAKNKEDKPMQSDSIVIEYKEYGIYNVSVISDAYPKEEIRIMY